ncbi:MAG TPA: NADPH-dependent FMN reductase [Clostridia bacterium]|nr:NADPH-dependent FMN reductase [Clostridia bacterium]
MDGNLLQLYVPIILGSTRRGRQSDKPARWIERRLRDTGRCEVELLDLAEYDFPIMEERLTMRDDPPPRAQEFSDKLRRADAIVIVTPEYNSGYPGVLKNTLDYFYSEYYRKPFGVVTVSGGGFGGITCFQSLLAVLQKVRGIVPAYLPIFSVQKTFDQAGNLVDPSYEKRASVFMDELLWYAEALRTQKERVTVTVG